MTAKVEQTFYAYCRECDWQSEVYDTNDMLGAEGSAVRDRNEHNAREHGL